MNGTHITGLGVLTLKLLPGSTGLAVELGFPSEKLTDIQLVGRDVGRVDVNSPAQAWRVVGAQTVSVLVWKPIPVFPLLRSLTGRQSCYIHVIHACVWSELQMPVSGRGPSTSQKCEPSNQLPHSCTHRLEGDRAIRSQSCPGFSFLKRGPWEVGWRGGGEEKNFLSHLARVGAGLVLLAWMIH